MARNWSQVRTMLGFANRCVTIFYPVTRRNLFAQRCDDKCQPREIRNRNVSIRDCGWNVNWHFSGASRNQTAASSHSIQEAGRRPTACYTRESQNLNKSKNQLNFSHLFDMPYVTITCHTSTQASRRPTACYTRESQNLDISKKLVHSDHST